MPELRAAPRPKGGGRTRRSGLVTRNVTRPWSTPWCGVLMMAPVRAETKRRTTMSYFQKGDVVQSKVTAQGMTEYGFYTVLSVDEMTTPFGNFCTYWLVGTDGRQVAVGNLHLLATKQEVPTPTKRKRRAAGVNAKIAKLRKDIDAAIAAQMKAQQAGCNVTYSRAVAREAFLCAEVDRLMYGDQPIAAD
jgi:hypothetical protein